MMMMILLLLLLLLLLFITFIWCIYNYIPETNHVSRVYNVSAVLVSIVLIIY
jgi:steroid 5-alpha reductase family enzyme